MAAETTRLHSKQLCTWSDDGHQCDLRVTLTALDVSNGTVMFEVAEERVSQATQVPASPRPRYAGEFFVAPIDEAATTLSNLQQHQLHVPPSVMGTLRLAAQLAAAGKLLTLWSDEMAVVVEDTNKLVKFFTVAVNDWARVAFKGLARDK